MLADKLSVERFGEVFPHMENILQCGLYSYSYETGSTYWSPGMYLLLAVEPYAIDCTVESFIRYILPEDRERVSSIVTKAREVGGSYEIDFSILDSRGIYKRLHAKTMVRKVEGR